MDLNQFSTVDIVLDKANDNFIQKQTISAGDRDGRSLTLQVTDAGSIGEVPGLTANLLWTNHSSGVSDLSAFSVVDRTTSVFKINYPQNMLTAGKVTAQIQLLHNGKVTHSKKFEIIVLDVAGSLKGVLQTAEYTTLVEALAKANGFVSDLRKLQLNKVDKTEMINELEKKSDKTEVVGLVGVKADKTYVDAMLSSIASGGPKELFYSIAALKAKYPNGAQGTYLVFDTTHTDGAHDYMWSENMWKDLGLHRADGIADGSITRRKIAKKEIGMQETRYLMAEGVPSKNIFPGWEKGGYDYTTGAINDANKIRTAELIPVTEGEYIWINDPESQSTTASNCQILFEFDANRNFLKYENINVFKERGYLPKANCHYVGIMSQTIGIGGFVVGDYKNYKTQIEYNTKFTGYETPWPKAKVENRTGLIIVDKESNTNKTITSAVANASDSPLNPLTIEINPGIYKESVSVGGGRQLSLIGKNKKDCIIKTTTGLYQDAPLEISGNGYVSNLTLIADYDVFPTDLTGMKAYALHVDYAGEGVIEFFNCHFKSSLSSALGLGTHDKQKIIFRNCLFESDTNPTLEYSKYGAAFLHASTVTTATNQRVEFYNCRFRSTNENVLWIADVNGSSTIEIGFYNCMLWSDINGNADSVVKVFGQKVIIADDSYGNNVAKLNK